MSSASRRLGHPAVLIAVAVLLLICGAVIWLLGYTEHGAKDGDRFTELGAGIIAGGIVSIAFWFVDRASAERDRRREEADRERHEGLIKAINERDPPNPGTER